MKRGVGEGRSGFRHMGRPLSHSQGDKMALRAVGDSSPMGELPCFRNFWLCNACRSEKSASTSLDARISVGVHGWTLTPPQRLGVDANLAFGQNSKSCRKLCMPCIYTCNMYMVMYPYYHHSIHALFTSSINTCTRNCTN